MYSKMRRKVGLADKTLIANVRQIRDTHILRMYVLCEHVMYCTLGMGECNTVLRITRVFAFYIHGGLYKLYWHNF